jgi:hypothetical protein
MKQVKKKLQTIAKSLLALTKQVENIQKEVHA